MNTFFNILLNFNEMQSLSSAKRMFSIFGIFTGSIIFITIAIMVLIFIKQIKMHKRMRNGGEEELINKISDNFQKFGESFKKGKDGSVTCQYCGGTYTSNQNKCPHCGATKSKQ